MRHSSLARSRGARFAASLFAALHLMVAALGPLADAKLEASEQKFLTHLESERSRPCSTGHDEVFCQICRVIGISGDTPAPPCTLQVLAKIIVPATSAPQHAVARLTLAAHGPRAPPVA